MDDNVSVEVKLSYSSKESMKAYVSTFDSTFCRFSYEYSVDKILDNVKGKVLLDIPCGVGQYSRIAYKKGADKIIAVDVAPECIRLAEEMQAQEDIPKESIQYFTNDAKLTKVFSSEMADICLSLHLFCFARNWDELVSMSRSLYCNMKPGGLAIIHFDSIQRVKGDNEDMILNIKESWNKMYHGEMHVKFPDYELGLPGNVEAISGSGFIFKSHLWPQNMVSLCMWFR